MEFLTLGDLVNLLNRNRSNLREVRSLEISRVTSIIKNARLISVRNSISHPMRGSSPGDETRLISYGRVLPIEAPNMVWTPLWDRMDRVQEILANNPSLDGLSSFNFPDEQYEVKNNLPNADYDFDTGGFIGRKSEQGELTDLMKQHPVVTILGVGGMGKTALALRVCNDIKNDPSFELDSIVWVSLKTQYLTSNGVQDIADSVRDVEGLVDELSPLVATTDHSSRNRLDGVYEQLKEHSILLIIDNLETLGNEIEIAELVEVVSRRDSNSKILFTSRRGIGESERRFDISGLSPGDAGELMRTFGENRGYDSIERASNMELQRDCKRLYFNPLLIKWFVQAVGRGASPKEILSHASKSNEQALSFCFDNVYESLSEDGKIVIAILLAADWGGPHS